MRQKRSGPWTTGRPLVAEARPVVSKVPGAFPPSIFLAPGFSTTRSETATWMKVITRVLKGEAGGTDLYVALPNDDSLPLAESGRSIEYGEPVAGWRCFSCPLWLALMHRR